MSFGVADYAASTRARTTVIGGVYDAGLAKVVANFKQQ
mgnify:CR=1 FL=1